MRRGDILLMALAQGTSTLGDAAATVTLALRLHDATHSSWLVASLMFAILGPSVACAPAAGRIVSRLGPRAAFILAACVQAAAVSALAIGSSPGLTLALAAVVGAGFAVSQPAAMTLLPSVATGDDALVRANSLLKTADWTGWTAGPVLGGSLVALGAARPPLLLDGLSFLIAAGLIGAVRVARDPAVGTVASGDAVPPGDASADAAPPGAPGPQRRGWLGGFRYAASDRPLASLLLVAGIASGTIAMASIAEVFLARDVLHAGPFGYATLGAVFMASTVAGALLTPRLRRFPGATATGCLVPAGAAFILTGAAGTVAPALTCYALAGLASGVQANACRSMVQRRVARYVPGDLHGDIFSVFVAVTMGAQLAGFAVGAGMIEAAGARAVMWLAGGCAALAGVVGVLPRQSRLATGPVPEAAGGAAAQVAVRPD